MLWCYSMKKIKMKFDYDFADDFSLYLLGLYGIVSANVDNKNSEIILAYDSFKTSLKLLIKEILLYLDLVNVPSIVAFDKYSTDCICNDVIVIKDLCCDYCLKNMIEELLEIDGIESAYTDFEYCDKYDVNIFITYNDKIINKEKLDDLKYRFNN